MSLDTLVVVAEWVGQYGITTPSLFSRCIHSEVQNATSPVTCYQFTNLSGRKKNNWKAT